MSDDYEAYYQNRLEAGLTFQDFVTDVLYQARRMIVQVYSSKAYQQAMGESCQGVEIKYDERLATTGNLYIETGEKAHPRPGPYVASGIYRSDNTWLYVIGDYTVLFAFTNSMLRAFHRSGRFRHVQCSLGTSEGFLIQRQDAGRAAAFVLEPKKLNLQHTPATPVASLERIGKLLFDDLRRDPRQSNFFDKLKQDA